MTQPMPPLGREELAVVDNYRTCEFATLSRSGVPIAWPTSQLRGPDGTFVITTSIALPQKAYNIRRDPRVAMLFSEPTGSGVEGAPQLLVQGTATCPDVIRTGVLELEEYWRRLYERQPAGRLYSANALSRRLFDWYYMRLVITVTPTVWSTRAPLPPGRPTVTAGAPDGMAGDALRRLATFPSAVLGTRDAAGVPVLQRVRVTGPGDGSALTLSVPGDDVPPGPASLLAHGHSEKLWNLRSVVVLGTLRRAASDWVFVPERVVAGADATKPLQVVRAMRDMRRTAGSYLERRSLPRPRIAWEEVERLTAEGTGRRPEPGARPPSSR